MRDVEKLASDVQSELNQVLKSLGSEIMMVFDAGSEEDLSLDPRGNKFTEYALGVCFDDPPDLDCIPVFGDPRVIYENKSHKTNEEIIATLSQNFRTTITPRVETGERQTIFWRVSPEVSAVNSEPWAAHPDSTSNVLRIYFRLSFFRSKELCKKFRTS